MADDCNPFYTDGFVFPRRPFNRPALPHIGYRIGAYPEFLEAMLRDIDRAPELSAFTHRHPDDPAIALVEGAAILGDILSFYQERYANEAFLRTAAWRESIAELVRLTGYRLAPGIGGLATFAFQVKGKAPVTLPAGFPVKADLEEQDKPADFQTRDELTAHPHLSRFSLYRARGYAGSLAAGATTLEIATVAGVTGPDALAPLKLKAGDRLMLLPPEPAWTHTGSALSPAQKTPQIVKVKAVRQILDRTLVDLETPLRQSWAKPATAYRLGRSFRHFGHNAPLTRTTPDSDASGTITGSSVADTRFRRHLGIDHVCSMTDCSLDLSGRTLPLDQQVNDLPVNAGLLVQTRVDTGAGTTVRDLVEYKTLVGLRTTSLGFGSLTGSSTLLTLDTALMGNPDLDDAQADVRDYLIHEVTSPALGLVPQAHDPAYGAAFSDGNQALRFFGTQAEARTLAGRRLILVDEQGRRAELTCTNSATGFVMAVGAHEPRMWSLSFDAPPAPFTRADFDEEAPSVTVYGNLADATQGKAEAETVLGNGDARLRFQTFKLPKGPLTWLLSAGATPPQAPELDVRVGGRLWTRVDSFFGQSPDARVYIVREDPEGNSYVQFGDGETGARLPSGIKNVSAAWRTGSGAFGPLKAGASPSAGSKVEGLDKVALPGVVSGGTEPEVQDKARRAAPGKVQGLGRLVSLADYESETLAIPGVVTASAAWAMNGGVPGLTLRVLMAAGRETEFETVRATLQDWQRCRGPNRFPVTVEQAFLRYLWLDLEYAGDPALATADLEAAIRGALGLAGDEASRYTGLFGLGRRRLGQKEYASRIQGSVQAVPGVLWCRATALGMFAPNDANLPEDDDPANLALPAMPRSLAAVLSPASQEMLQLAPPHLTLVSVATPAGACP
ncbi:MAG: hypothetical protein AB1899_07990 [Pseudomonadota bacterium]